MSIIISDCPHCRSRNMSFTVFGALPAPDMSGMASVSIAAGCRNCGLPITVRLKCVSTGITAESFISYLDQRGSAGYALETSDTVRVSVWPQQEPARIPSDIPAEVERALVQAEKNFSTDDCEEAAAMMYRRALELGIKAAYPTLSGSLATRIKNLVRDHHLPSPIGDWLDQVRIVGNDGAHELDGVTREDLEAARGFVDTALRYIFTLPAQIAVRRGLPSAVA